MILLLLKNRFKDVIYSLAVGKSHRVSFRVGEKVLVCRLELLPPTTVNFFLCSVGIEYFLA